MTSSVSSLSCSTPMVIRLLRAWAIMTLAMGEGSLDHSSSSMGQYLVTSLLSLSTEASDGVGKPHVSHVVRFGKWTRSDGTPSVQNTCPNPATNSVTP
ncbi:MAG: hypothetical protein J3Q66DRAFT_321553 [Benniella sp.]|nr:MAG: hypothetical protein J3Q66DRAFT_321553 [Benniella sp.]